MTPLQILNNFTGAEKKFDDLMKSLEKQLHESKAIFICYLEFEEDKDYYRMEYSIPLKKTKKDPKNVLYKIKTYAVRISDESVEETSYFYIYKDLPLEKIEDLSYHLKRLVFSSPIRAIDFDLLVKKIRTDRLGLENNDDLKDESDENFDSWEDEPDRFIKRFPRENEDEGTRN